MPHVFENEKANNSLHANQNWERAKHKEKNRKSRIDGVPKGLPSIIQAQRLQQKASHSGFDWKNSKDVWKKINEEIEELKIAEKDGDINQIENELGDAIFSLVNLARFLDISAENALRKTNDKFKNRFRYIEKVLKKNGKKFEETKLRELDKYWNEAKGKE
ncbi:MAG: MazG family protein [Candidatus Neomarinimicrobiota bacterium]